MVRSSSPALLALCAAAVAGCSGDIGAPSRSEPIAAPTPAPTPRPSATPTPTPTPTPIPPFAPGAAVVRRLVAPHDAATIRTLLGAEAARVAAPPPDAALNGLDAIGAAQLAIDAAAVRAYESSARAVAEAAVAAGALARWASCTPAGPGDAACYRAFVQSFGRALFRRALDAEELDGWVALASEAGTRTGRFDGGLTTLIAGLLQAPSFLYRLELGVPDAQHPGWKKLTAHELAARLAFFLTEHGPDAELLDAADRDALSTPDQLRAQAERLLATPDARLALAAFYDEVLQLRALRSVSKNATLFPELDLELRDAMREETQRLIADLVWTQDADFRRIFTADYSFVDARLASLYGFDRPAGPGFVRVPLPASTQRAGILGHAAFHTLHSHATTTSPTLRGKFVREVLMCETIQPPPPGVITVLPQDPPNGPRTNRQRLEDAHYSNPSCSGCHAQMDGIGFGLEHFDPIGRWRDRDNGIAIDARTDLDGAPFRGAAELGALLHPMKSTMVCAARGLYRQAVGRVEAGSEEAAIQAIVAGFEGSGWRMQKLLAEIVASDGFRYVKAD